MSEKFVKHYHLQITKSLDDGIKEGLETCKNDYGVRMYKSDFIKMSVEYFIEHCLEDKNRLESALKDMKYI